MAGLGIRLYTDEMVDIRLATALRTRGYDVESCQEAGRSNQQIPDDDQLSYAASQSRAVFTFNFVDYLELDARWKAAGRRHAGIIISGEIRQLSEMLRRVAWHLDHYSPDDQDDLVLWLSTNPGT